MEKSSTGSSDECTGGDSDPNKDSIAMTTTASNEQDNPFAEYLWMGDPKQEDEVNLQVMEEILEEEFIESCFEDMLEEEALGLFTPPGEEPSNDELVDEGNDEIIPSLHGLSLDESGVVVDVENRDDENEDHEEDGWRGGANGSSPPSGFGGQSSDGESENSDADSLGDTPQR